MLPAAILESWKVCGTEEEQQQQQESGWLGCAVSADSEGPLHFSPSTRFDLVQEFLTTFRFPR